VQAARRRGCVCRKLIAWTVLWADQSVQQDDSIAAEGRVALRAAKAILKRHKRGIPLL